MSRHIVIKVTPITGNRPEEVVAPLDAVVLETYTGGYHYVRLLGTDAGYKIEPAEYERVKNVLFAAP